MITWVYYPQFDKQPEIADKVVEVFRKAHNSIDSSRNELISNEVLTALSSGLIELGFQVEMGKRGDQKISIPVLFGKNGKVIKSFDADAFHVDYKFVIEVEAGRGVTNNQFLKDLFEACMMQDIEYLAVAIRNDYQGNKNFDTVTKFFDTLYTSNRLKLPLKGVLVIGY